MSRQTITISNDEIAYAESILLRNGQEFDEERRAFIRNLDTIDLQAVPGSGKTTALLAKLLILERHLPFQDGSGILVLSHTNSAIDEIGRRIGSYCPRLLAYPSFVGTIQRFVDEFLAQPFAESNLNRRFATIDNEAYQEEIWSRFQGIYWNKEAGEPGKWLYGRHINAAQKQAQSAAAAKDLCRRYIEQTVKDMYIDFRDRRVKLVHTGNTLLNPGSGAKYQAISQIIENTLLASGSISYDYAYHLADVWLETAPHFIRLLRKRFVYVFVDEMQDMEERQYGILETLFGNEDVVAYQRIGDKNQAIYSHEVKIDEIWTDRDSVLYLTGSHRLSPHVAEVVTPFATSPTSIEGRNAPSRVGTDNDLLPHVIVFDDVSAGDVIPRFCELIRTNTAAGKIPSSPEHPIKAIAWVKGDHGLGQYWRDYQPEAVRSKIVHPNLRNYVACARQENWQVSGLGPINKRIMDGLLRVLYLEGVRNLDSKTGYFSVRSFHRFLAEKNSDEYAALRLKCLSWSRQVYAGEVDQAYDDIRDFIPRLLKVFDRQLTNAVDFVNGEAPEEAAKRASGSDNIYRCPTTGIEVHVGTVHSAKGETHTATLYLESYYHNDGGKSYESERLQAQFKGETLGSNIGKRVKQSARMVYVGFSRPTHLLCFAVHKDRFHKDAFPAGRWEEVRIFRQ